MVGVRINPYVTNYLLLSISSFLKKFISCYAHFNTLDWSEYLQTLINYFHAHVKLVGFFGDNGFQLQKHVKKFILALHFDA